MDEQPRLRDILRNRSVEEQGMEIQTLKSLSVSRASTGEFPKALEALYALKEKLFKKYGPDPRVTALNRIDIQIAGILYLQGEFDEAFHLYTQTLEKMDIYSRDYVDEIFEAKCFIASLYSRKMEKDMAAKHYEDLRKHIATLPADRPQTIELKRNLALSLKRAGELQSALDIFIEIYHAKKVIYGEKSRITEYSHAEVGSVFLEQGKFREALSILEGVHSTFRMEMFEEISYLRLKRSLADAHMYLGLVKIAEDLYRSLMDVMLQRIPYHPEVLATMHNWGRSLAKIKKPREAVEVLKEVYNARCIQTPKHPETAKVVLDLATTYLNMKVYSEAIITFLNYPNLISNAIKWNPDHLIHSMSCIASILDATKDDDLKEQVFRTYQHVHQKLCAMRGLSNVHKDSLQTRTLIGELLISLNKPDDALKVLKEVLEKRTLLLKNDYIDCVDVLKNIARAYSDLNQRVEAFEFYSEVYEIQKLITGDNSVEAVVWENKIREIAPETLNTILIDAVVSSYRTSLKGNTDTENVNMEDLNFPLHVASETGRIAMIKFLLFKGAIYNEENAEGKTPLDIACNNAVKNLFNLVDKLFVAVKRMDHESIDQILHIMNDTCLREDVNKGFPMLYTGLDQIRDIVDKTILNARDRTGSTTLHLACSNGDTKMVKILLDLEVDRTLTDKSHKSPRDLAENKSFTEVLQLLDSCVTNKSNDLEDSTITQKNPEMPEDIMDT